jgi:plasmid stability protein
MPDASDAGEFVFRPEVHDAEAKVVLGTTLKAGRGIEDGEQVLDILAAHPSTAKYIARKLAVRFVSDTPPQALVDRAAATFRRTNGDMREVVRTIVTSPEFFSKAAFRAKVKSPFEVVVSTLRALDAAPDATPRTAQLVARLGQPIFGHQAPNGWPETSEAWMNTGAILNRINFGMAAAANRVPGATLDRWPDASRLANASRAEQVDGVIAGLLGGQASPETREILTTGVHPMVAKAAADSSASLVMASDTVSAPDAATPGDDPPGGRRQRRAAQGFGTIPELTGLAQVVGLALGSPEFQRR